MPTLKKCLDCPVVGTWSSATNYRCKKCRTTYRATLNEGKKARYAYAYQEMRAMWQHVVKVLGQEVTCCRCKERIWPQEDMDLDHVNYGTSLDRFDPQYLQPAHARCNRSHGATHERTTPPRRRTSYEPT